MDLRRVRKPRWELGTDSRYARSTSFNGDGTTYNTFGTVNIGGTTISTPPERQEPIRSHRTARAPYQSPTARALICTSDRVHRSFGSPRLREALAAARELVLERRHVTRFADYRVWRVPSAPNPFTREKRFGVEVADRGCRSQRPLFKADKTGHPERSRGIPCESLK